MNYRNIGDEGSDLLGIKEAILSLQQMKQSAPVYNFAIDSTLMPDSTQVAIDINQPRTQQSVVDSSANRRQEQQPAQTGNVGIPPMIAYPMIQENLRQKYDDAQRNKRDVDIIGKTPGMVSITSQYKQIVFTVKQNGQLKQMHIYLASLAQPLNNIHHSYSEGMFSFVYKGEPLDAKFMFLKKELSEPSKKMKSFIENIDCDVYNKGMRGGKKSMVRGMAVSTVTITDLNNTNKIYTNHLALSLDGIKGDKPCDPHYYKVANKEHECDAFLFHSLKEQTIYASASKMQPDYEAFLAAREEKPFADPAKAIGGLFKLELSSVDFVWMMYKFNEVLAYYREKNNKNLPTGLTEQQSTSIVNYFKTKNIPDIYSAINLIDTVIEDILNILQPQDPKQHLWKVDDVIPVFYIPVDFANTTGELFKTTCAAMVMLDPEELKLKTHLIVDDDENDTWDSSAKIQARFKLKVQQFIPVQFFYFVPKDKETPQLKK